MYCLVEFIAENTDKPVVDIITDAWLADDPNRVMWPPAGKRKKLLEREQRPEPGTRTYPIKILRMFRTLPQAMQALKDAEENSDIGGSQETHMGKFCRRK